MQTDSSESYRYWAFISYSNKDEKWARWLHRAIETYGIPAQLVSHPTPSGSPAPRRFRPIFRDRDELPASSDLSAQIKNALRSSQYLIVVCTPAAAQSQWVNKEIEKFHSFGRKDRVLAIIVDGEPNANNDSECFPPALRRVEPIAADARPEGDGKTNAKLKLLAGMLGVSFDALKQRDNHRRIRRLQWAILASLLLSTGFAALAWYANYQRAKAVKAREYAETALSFLLYEVNDERPIMLPVRLASNIPTQDEYRSLLMRNDPLPLTLHSQPPLDRYVNASDGTMDQLLTEYQRRINIFKWLVQHHPNKLVFRHDLAVSYNNIGDVRFARGDLVGALASYQESLAITERLADRDPRNAEWQRDLVVSYWRMADICEETGSDEAMDWWRKAYEKLSDMKRRGLFISPQDEQYLQYLRSKVGQ